MNKIRQKLASGGEIGMKESLTKKGLEFEEENFILYLPNKDRPRMIIDTINNRLSSVFTLPDDNDFIIMNVHLGYNQTPECLTDSIAQRLFLNVPEDIADLAIDIFKHLRQMVPTTAFAHIYLSESGEPIRYDIQSDVGYGSYHATEVDMYMGTAEPSLRVKGPAPYSLVKTYMEVMGYINTITKPTKTVTKAPIPQKTVIHELGYIEDTHWDKPED